jgi:hypothetical protein
MKQMAPGVFGMVAAYASDDIQVNAADRNAIWYLKNQTGYSNADTSTDEQANASVTNAAWNKRNAASQVSPSDASILSRRYAIWSCADVSYHTDGGYL